MIVAFMVLSSVLVTAAAAYLLNKLNRY